MKVSECGNVSRVNSAVWKEKLLFDTKDWESWEKYLNVKKAHDELGL